MSGKRKKLSNPASTGGMGPHFEAHVQASYVTLMLTGGYVPCLRCWPIREIKLQGKIDGFDTDDLIVFLQSPDGTETQKLLGQVKHGLRVGHNKRFGEVIQAAWDDFCSPQRFTKGRDAIAAISDAMTRTDIEDVCWLLDHARCMKTPGQFLRHVGTANFSSDQKRKKLAVLRGQLGKANNGQALTDQELYDFLKHFYLLGYDLGKEEGVVLSLLHSHISQYNRDRPRMVWGRIVDIVQTWNQHAGTITRANLPADILDEFRPKAIESIPAEIISRPPTPPPNLSTQSYSQDLARALLLGGWDESAEDDIQIVVKLARQEYDKWAASVREALEAPRSPLVLRNGIWTTRHREGAWKDLGKKVSDADLNAIKTIALDVLSERSPVFELPRDERYMANIKGKALSYSVALREGISDTLAVMGGKSETFVHCSDGKAEGVAVLVVRELLEEADWLLWGSLNHLLPLLAEAAPSAFLSAVETSLARDPCPFGRLFAEEGNGTTGNNYMTGLLWALETLAWDQQYLTRAAVLLGELAVVDPGGNWSNRPLNSLTTIFLPWLPQTTAPFRKCSAAIRTLVKESPTSAWLTLISLLPNQHQVSSGSHKPRWRQTIAEGWDKGRTQKAYWHQVTVYAELALNMTGHDIGRLGTIVENLDNLPPAIFDRLLEQLVSPDIVGLPEQDRTQLWSDLLAFTGRHRLYSDADWALSSDVLKRIDAVAAKLAPAEPSNLYRRLFSGRDHDLHEEHGDWREQDKRLRSRRQSAIVVIYESGGIDAVLRFAESVESAAQVGEAFGMISGKGDDALLLPSLLDDVGDAIGVFMASYTWAKQQRLGWEWVDGVLSPDWSTRQSSSFLRSLPFHPDTWKRVDMILRKGDEEYWREVLVNPFQLERGFGIAVDKLLEHGRPSAAIDCLYVSGHRRRPLDHARTVRALLAAVACEEQVHSMGIHHAVALIKALQVDKDTDPDDLFEVEWAYLTALDGHNGARPQLLEQRLASEPAFFCEIIRLIFRSRHDDAEAKEATEQQRKLASHAYQLLHEWRSPPGTLADGSFSPVAFQEWLAETKAICERTGHAEVALSRIGQVLIHVPPDADGLWIDRTVAEALNAREAEDMRSGFHTGKFNSRGVVTLVASGAPEDELAAAYRQQADATEEAGFHRLASTMQDLSEVYSREAERIRRDHRFERRHGEDAEDAKQSGR